MSEELKPCPHCGSESCRVIGGPGTKGGPQYWAGCDHCNGRAWGDTEAEAIAAWNRRASPTPPTTEGWLPNFSQIYSELEKARENLNRRYLNNNDQSAGRSSRAVFSAMRLLDTARALLSSPRAEDVRREVWKEAARIAGRW